MGRKLWGEGFSGTTIKNWNIINRRKKRKQNITRDIEVKNNLLMGRGEGGRNSREKGFQEIV